MSLPAALSVNDNLKCNIFYSCGPLFNFSDKVDILWHVYLFYFIIYYTVHMICPACFKRPVVSGQGSATSVSNPLWQIK